MSKNYNELKTKRKIATHELQKIYKHKSGKRIFFNAKQDFGNYTLRNLKRRLEQSKKIGWNVFLHLTYNTPSLNSASGQDVRKLINNIKQFNRNKVRDYSKYPRWQKIKEYYKQRNEKFAFVWKRETTSSGKRKYNPHYHVIISSPFFMSKSKIDEWWSHRIPDLNFKRRRLMVSNGFTTMKTIFDPKRAKMYVYKYIMKKERKSMKYGRTYGHSRNLPEGIKSWSYEGMINLKSAMQIEKYQKEVLTGAKVQAHIDEYLIKRKPYFQ